MGLGLALGACSTKPPVTATPPPEAATSPSRPAIPDLAAHDQAGSSTAASTSRNPTAVVVPASVTGSAALLCRDAWGASPARPGGRRHTITRMTVHHSAVVLGDNHNAPARLRQHQHYHQVDRGWIDIAYHVGVDRNGNIYELRTPELVGDTATNYDPAGHFLVLCEGDFDKEPITEAQLNSAALVFAWAAQTFHIASDTIAGHRDFAATSCPGANLYAHVSSGDLNRRIGDFLAAGTVDLRPVCGSEAATLVEDIEAGR